jgi:phage terminase large subunit-like protein
MAKEHNSPNSPKLARQSMDLAMGLDPAFFFTRAAGFAPDPWQADVLRSRSSRMLLNCCRQSGKSTVAAVIALWTALYLRGSQTLIVSPTERQSQLLFRKALDAYHNLGQPVPARSETAMQLELDSGSRIIALPGKEGTIRGYSADLILFDEAARVPDAVYEAVMPMVAVTRGRMIAMSTPFGARGWWYHLCMEAKTSRPSGS